MEPSEKLLLGKIVATALNIVVGLAIVVSIEWGARSMLDGGNSVIGAGLRVLAMLVLVVWTLWILVSIRHIFREIRGPQGD